jgi:hypothetical protein
MHDRPDTAQHNTTQTRDKNRKLVKKNLPEIVIEASGPLMSYAEEEASGGWVQSRETQQEDKPRRGTKGKAGK